jgi:6-phosphofructokinase 2
VLEQLIHKAIAFEAVAVQSWTRESFVAVDDNTILNTVLVLQVV